MEYEVRFATVGQTEDEKLEQYGCELLPLVGMSVSQIRFQWNLFKWHTLRVPPQKRTHKIAPKVGARMLRGRPLVVQHTNARAPQLRDVAAQRLAVGHQT